MWVRAGKRYVRFAGLFDEAVGVDQDAGMLTEAARLAAERNVANVRWVRMLAEELPGTLGTSALLPSPPRFTGWTAMRSRPRRWRCSSQAARSSTSTTGTRSGLELQSPGTVPPPPDEAITELRQRYLGPERRAGQATCDGSPGNEAAVFRGAGFEGPETIVVPDGRVLERSVDDVVAGRVLELGLRAAPVWSSGWRRSGQTFVRSSRRLRPQGYSPYSCPPTN